MRPCEHSNSVLRRFKNVVTAERNQASTDEGKIRQCVNRSKLAHTVEQEDASSAERSAGLGIPRAAFYIGQSRGCNYRRDFLKALRMAGRKDHYGVRKLLKHLAEEG